MIVVAIGAALLSAASEATDASTPAVVAAPVTAYVTALAGQLPEVAASALARIDGEGRKLLAARSYLRAGPGLANRWSWSDEQIARYQSSDEHRAALAEIDKITARFAELNPGYTLYVNTDVRSLDVQLARWNENASVEAASTALLQDATRELVSYPLPADRAAVERFIRWVQAWRPPQPPTLAAPGLSPHGQSRAFDFQIQMGVTLVAGTDSSQIETVWEAGGWTQKLAQAVAVSSHFRGPLVSPREPWHYEYVP